jgi:hypothetical protein
VKPAHAMTKRDFGWPICLVALPILLAMAGILSSRLTAHPNWLEAASDARRGGFMATIAGASGSLLGFVIAALAILIALPDTESARSLRRYRGWRVLQLSLLAAAMNLLVLLAFALYAGVSDGDIQTAVIIGYAIGSVACVGVCGALFGLVLVNIVRDNARSPE